jgi:hypothetical protein
MGTPIFGNIMEYEHHSDHPAIGITGDHRIANAGERDPQPLTLLRSCRSDWYM